MDKRLFPKQRLTLLVLDILKPHEPDNINFAKALSAVPGVSRVDLSLDEMDERTQTLRVIIAGDNIDYGKLRKTIEELGGSIHSVDRVVVTKG